MKPGSTGGAKLKQRGGGIEILGNLDLGRAFLRADLQPKTHRAKKSKRVRIFLPAVLLGLALLCGCKAKVARQSVSDSTGSNTLALIVMRTRPLRYLTRREEYYDFDSLVWRAKEGGEWMNRVVISKAAFQGTNAHQRWVSEIAAINPTNGTAIIKVAEADAPPTGPIINYVYSWREWSLLTNGEVHFIRVCTNVFDKY